MPYDIGICFKHIIFVTWDITYFEDLKKYKKIGKKQTKIIIYQNLAFVYLMQDPLNYIFYIKMKRMLLLGYIKACLLLSSFSVQPFDLTNVALTSYHSKGVSN